MKAKTRYIEQKIERNQFQISYCPNLNIQYHTAPNIWFSIFETTKNMSSKHFKSKVTIWKPGCRCGLYKT